MKIVKKTSTLAAAAGALAIATLGIVQGGGIASAANITTYWHSGNYATAIYAAPSDTSAVLGVGYYPDKVLLICQQKGLDWMLTRNLRTGVTGWSEGFEVQATTELPPKC